MDDPPALPDVQKVACMGAHGLVGIAFASIATASAGLSQWTASTSRSLRVLSGGQRDRGPPAGDGGGARCVSRLAVGVEDPGALVFETSRQDDGGGVDGGSHVDEGTGEDVGDDEIEVCQGEGAEGAGAGEMDAAGEAVVGHLAPGEGKGEGVVVDGDDVTVPQDGGGDRENGRPAPHVENTARRRVEAGKGLEAPGGGRMLTGPETGAGPHADEVACRLAPIIAAPIIAAPIIAALTVAALTVALDDGEGSHDEGRKGADVLGDPVPRRQFVEGGRKTKMCREAPARAFGFLAAGEERLHARPEEGKGQGPQVIEEGVCLRMLRLELPDHAGVTVMPA